MSFPLHSPDDTVLLGEYIANGSEAAFAELMTRYVDLVHSACARQLRDPNDAQDATQAVFIVLARKAHSIRQRHSLGAWLLTVARFAATDLRTRKLAARERELAAAQLRPESATQETCSHEVIVVLDDALATLAERDRALLVMRYFEGRTARESAAFLGISENAAALRASRALRRLRTAIERKGPAISIAALPELLLSKAIQPASAVLRVSAALNVSAMQTLSVAPVTIAKGAMMKMFKTQLVSVLKVTAIVLITVSALTWFVAHALAQYEPDQFYGVPLTAAAIATTQSYVAATPEAVLIKTVIMENDKVVSRPYVSTSVGQTASVSVAEGADHQLTLTLTAGEAQGAFRQVKIEAKDTLGTAHYSLTTTAYFRDGEATTFKLTLGKDAPEETLSITVKKATPAAR